MALGLQGQGKEKSVFFRRLVIFSYFFANNKMNQVIK
jgi:hypothetical protein